MISGDFFCLLAQNYIVSCINQQKENLPNCGAEGKQNVPRPY